MPSLIGLNNILSPTTKTNSSRVHNIKLNKKNCTYCSKCFLIQINDCHFQESMLVCLLKRYTKKFFSGALTTSYEYLYFMCSILAVNATLTNAHAHTQ